MRSMRRRLRTAKHSTNHANLIYIMSSEFTKRISAPFYRLLFTREIARARVRASDNARL